MHIENNILKYYLRNVLFINGTAYAGKSTTCSMLAEKFGLVHCKENYHFAMPQEQLSLELQPNICYFSTMKDWQEFVNRPPEVYDAWIQGGACEAAQIEVAELIRLSQNGKIIADTNISPDLLKQIADYHQVALMLSPQSMSVERFFERNDPDKVFVRAQIMKSADPEKTMANYKACIARINSKEHYDEFAQSGLFTLVRSDDGRDTKQETMELLADHFGLSDKSGDVIATEHFWVRPIGEGNMNFAVFEKDTGLLIGNVQLNNNDASAPECCIDADRNPDDAREVENGVRCWARSYFKPAPKGS